MENILLQKDNEKLKQEIDDQNFYIDDLIKENQNLEDDNDKQKTKLIEYEEKISYLTSEHESNLNWIQNLQKKDTEFEEDLSQYILDLNKKGEQLDDANQKQETMIYQLKQEKQQNLGQLIEYNKKFCSLAEEHKNHISLMHSLEKNNSQQKIDVDKLYKKCLKLQRKQEKTDAINSDLTKEVSELYDKNYKIRKNLKKSKKRVFNLTNKQNNYIKITRKYAKKENGQIEKYQTLHMMYRIAIECVEDEKKEKERMIEQIEQKRVEERKTFKKSEADVIDTSLKMLESKEKTIKVLEDELKASQKKIEKLELEKNTLSDELKDTRAQISENLNNLQKMITLNSELKKRKFKMKKLLKKTTEEYRIYKKSLFLRKKKTRSMPGKPLETQNMSIAFKPEEASAVSSAGHVSGLQRNGSAVTITGGEPDFSADVDALLALLPEDIRADVIEEQKRLVRPRQQGPEQPHQTCGTGQGMQEVNPEFLASLPQNIQEEVLAQKRFEQKKQNDGSRLEYNDVQSNNEAELVAKKILISHVSMASQPDIDVDQIKPVETVLLSNPEPETSSSSPDQKTRSMPVKPLKTQNVSMASKPDVDVDHIQPFETHSANKSGEEAAAVSSDGHVSGLQRNGSAVTSTGGEPDFSANLCETFNIKELNEVDKTLSKYTSNAHLVIIPNQKLSYPKIMKLKNEYRIEIDQHLTEIHLTGKYKSVGRVVNILKHDEKKRCVGVAPDFKIVPTLDFSQISPHTVEAMMKYFKEKENITVTQKENFCTFEEITVKKFRTFFKSF